jgi:hypothetical protein
LPATAAKVDIRTDVNIILAEGARTRIETDSDHNEHIATYGICGAEVKLPATAESYVLDACRVERREINKPIVVVDDSETGSFRKMLLLSAG